MNMVVIVKHNRSCTFVLPWSNKTHNKQSSRTNIYGKKTQVIFPKKIVDENVYVSAKAFFSLQDFTVEKKRRHVKK